MCLQYWRSRGLPRKQRLLTWRGGYHGDTFMAMSVCDPEGGMHRMWDGVLPRQVFAGLPRPGSRAGVDEAYAVALGRLIERHAAELAAVIVEPVVQGAGGMRFHDPGYLRVLREACDDTACCWSSTRSPPASAAAGPCSRPGTPGWRPM